jgi:hypothetical protein
VQEPRRVEPEKKAPAVEDEHELAEASVERATRHNVDRTTRREALELELLDEEASPVGAAIPDAGDPDAVDHELIGEIAESAPDERGSLDDEHRSS